VATEAEINRTIDALRGVKTVFVIAHRLSSVKKCDRLVWLRPWQGRGRGVVRRAATAEQRLQGSGHARRGVGQTTSFDRSRWRERRAGRSGSPRRVRRVPEKRADEAWHLGYEQSRWLADAGASFRISNPPGTLSKRGAGAPRYSSEIGSTHAPVIDVRMEMGGRRLPLHLHHSSPIRSPRSAGCSSASYPVTIAAAAGPRRRASVSSVTDRRSRHPAGERAHVRRELIRAQARTAVVGVQCAAARHAARGLDQRPITSPAGALVSTNRSRYSRLETALTTALVSSIFSRTPWRTLSARRSATL